MASAYDSRMVNGRLLGWRTTASQFTRSRARTRIGFSEEASLFQTDAEMWSLLCAERVRENHMYSLLFGCSMDCLCETCTLLHPDKKLSLS